MKSQQIDLALAQRIVLNSQLLDGQWKPKGKEGVAQTIEKLGYIQVDTISVIQRAHHHVLWTRCPGYQPAILDELQTHDRRIFEYWAHAAAYLPINDYRFYLPRMKTFKEKTPWVPSWFNEFRHLHQPIMERFRNEGALGAKDFEKTDHTPSNGWWEWKPAKRVLEHLFWSGELMVTRRDSFQKIYDLPERVLPSGIDCRWPDDDELGRFFVRRTLQAYGIATEKEISDHLKGAKKKHIKNALQDLITGGEIVAVTIQSLDKHTYFAFSQYLESASGKLQRHSSRVFLLSPFDNLVIQRERIKRLFDFDYTIECYLPAEKRKYGYFTLPVLWNGRLIARLDPKAERKQKTFFVRNLVFEPGFNDFKRLVPRLAETINQLATFNQCEKVIIENTGPAKVKEMLTQECVSQ